VITAVKGAEPETPWRRLLGDGEALYNDLAGLCLAVVVAVPTARVTAAIGFALPLTVLVQRSQRHAELAGQARIDGKTGLLNAHTWQREAHIEITRAVRRATPLAVAMVDIDHFKHINDTYGHLAGDTVLATLAATVRSVLRDTDIAGRFGGEEFALLLPATTREQARQITGHLCTRLAQIITPVVSAAGKWQLKVTVSIGVVTLHASRRDLTDLLAAADLALYQAKERGRDQVCIFGE
jgi:diguanylate cyclase (GGDEF)-like protein